MPKRRAYDRILLGAVVLLTVVGGLMVASASFSVSQRSGMPTFHYLVRQIVYAAIGFAALVIFMKGVPYRSLNRPRVVWSFYIFTAVLLVGVLFLDGVNGSRRWYRFGHFSFQPSEVSKLALVITLAYLLGKKKSNLNDFTRSVLPFFLCLGLFPMLIAIEPDMGTALTLAVLGTLMILVAGLAWKYVVVTAAIGLPAAYTYIMMAPYRMRRIEAYLDPWTDPQGAGFHSIQSLIAVGTGHLFGLGPGGSIQKLRFLPEPDTDFIFAVISEELGLLGASVLLALFAVVCWRGLRIAARAPDRFGVYLALGITLTVVVQALINIGVVTKLLPITGLPLPFVSRGGSSLVVSLASMGVLLNISQES